VADSCWRFATFVAVHHDVGYLGLIGRDADMPQTTRLTRREEVTNPSELTDGTPKLANSPSVGEAS
jgi:hypothetical protein